MIVRSILVVCTGNICRSPIGERILAALCPDIDVSSAGIGALVGKGIDADAALVAAQHGVKTTDHVARQITSDMLSSHELVLAMAPEHRRHIGEYFPQAFGKTMLFDKWEGDHGIEDPYRKSAEMHKLVFFEIRKAAESWRRRLSQ
ncbi:arsenate reductase/protein-tyrosine-phosphatase family protein [Abyssibius alkaniclasticus]|uniref:arsenate reductase/protein-tyrosine-phosphatase family protein n=1 Tax=Abyssibius alkaniclasticus TaxID=2881234 RepID=UPI004057D5A8|tara:strand:+ start:131 stop:568 length:438 start_codon:yes stop_codon:yes gene_type:complete